MNTAANLLTAVSLVLGAIPLLVRTVIDVRRARREIQGLRGDLRECLEREHGETRA